ncbi:type II toxin-antitoxin system ParD family antitoxin [Chelatococcus sambhunathii]|uniref:Type II toxin-antitoxin system ParD family antitoxin n=1 Tax=Chelatococcus sambhunathii TaxID=363953 RepID=A0ABU1DCF5_9HYPH|nr:type II toxin-antitoxin system ParD family antitoxin [Chelatococcus sambhunathii]MDR4305784.1 type II toxin-antitoxin system ParD family antitoxin [Chelatococcus sambhunathii]
MATLMVSLSDPLSAWLDDTAQAAGFREPGDYVRELIRRDRERADRALTIDELRELVGEAKASGTSARSLDDIFAEAERVARSNG